MTRTVCRHLCRSSRSQKEFLEETLNLQQEWQQPFAAKPWVYMLTQDGIIYFYNPSRLLLCILQQYVPKQSVSIQLSFSAAALFARVFAVSLCIFPDFWIFCVLPYCGVTNKGLVVYIKTSSHYLVTLVA